MSDKNDLIIETFEGGVATLTLDNPPLNILNIAMLDQLTAAVERNLGAKIIMIEAKGKAFSAGADVGEHVGELARRMLASFHGVFRALARHRGLSVAVVDGPALGGGCELAAFCDVVLAGDKASFGQPESLVGVLPPVAAVLWPRLMGPRKAKELLITGEKISAEEAVHLGLVNKVFPSDRLEEEVQRFLTPFKTKSLVVIEHVKRAVRIGARGDFLDALDEVETLYLDSLMKTHDAEEGLRAFLEKRRPEWRDE
jgi:cyclohexa-1,5-dienecarbonyl-CoA hydratase